MSNAQMRADFEELAAPMGFDLTRQYLAVPEPWAEYVSEQTGYFWAGYQAATEKATQAERNFCERCGKRLGDSTDIHTCTPPTAT